MKAVNLLIKPSSSKCNMRCKYCFYGDLSELRSTPDCGMMTLETAQQLIKAAFDAADRGGEVSFAFQGGEPTLMGLEFYRRFLELERDFGRSDLRVSHSIQTNALLIDEAWADFLAEHHFLVGLSLDGEKDLHDFLRPDALGKGTWKRATAALSLLQKRRVEVNALCVVTAQCARSPVKVYNSLKKLGFSFLQFIPCLDPMEALRGSCPYSLTPEAYGKFLCQLFDVWYRDWKDGRYTSIRLFDDYVHLAMGLPGGTCSTTGACGGYLVCEGDGGLYPCDFYVLDQWRLGTVGEVGLAEALASPPALRFQAESHVRPEGCSDCRWARLCQGGCRRDRFAGDGGTENYYCPAFRQFFAYAETRLVEIAQAELRQRSR